VVVMHAAQQTQADRYAARSGAVVALPQAVADAAVYVAKRRGRNQVQMAAPLAA
jgi:hypothetical protein